MGFGDYPKDYDPAKHGPYDPAKYYGKPDTPFGDVKLSELPAWFKRRDKSVSAIMGVCSRDINGLANSEVKLYIIKDINELASSFNELECPYGSNPTHNTKENLITWWRWQHKYMQARRVGAAPFFQILIANMAFFYAINYGRTKKHRNWKYH